jgi:hypothetical protein
MTSLRPRSLGQYAQEADAILGKEDDIPELKAQFP